MSAPVESGPMTDDADIGRLVDGQHHGPHHLLGPHPGRWTEILNSDHADFGGSNSVTGAITAQAPGWNDLDYSATLTLPPVGALWPARGPGPS